MEYFFGGNDPDISLSQQAIQYSMMRIFGSLFVFILSNVRTAHRAI